MSYLQAVILGIIQGLTEFLPVSSSGHLLMMRHWMGLGEIPVLFDVLLHVATLIVVLVMFRKKVIELLASLFRWIARKTDEQDMKNMKLIAVILVAVFITGILGLLISELNVGETPKVVFPLYLVTATLLWFTRKAKEGREYRDLNFKDGIITGVAQGIGVLPGISRSGITISAGLYRGFNRDVAAEYSFLISIPAILGALILDMKDGVELLNSISMSVIGVAFMAALISGFLALWMLVRLINSGKFYYFCFYLVPLGILGLIFF
ncbi:MULTISPECIES: undecaprenyl-diphosphatase UppP [unclassified Oceanispirochaeta]|uniref:undecaprenyl-diphosphatase UppP n=1 Tax=unclassified Oceanispirochaeta TaxID=2635722 RepID=UPI000E0940EC|nr:MULTISPECIES: undecaprenyl-diphosphatase UppP [unclassified Oceanispirochaeta]MBF9015422.1 undecaprenyl-diphosphatase UppP [Oceanispirochaeta sp. M2]NPD71881.1 undecaprenyl-diphosphatase UppP [Oceanispirochaeta sp. M1]RDG32690.1 undecaprenyl-diphosphatase UppP [Oceanispirochaeta sp. M1]